MLKYVKNKQSLHLETPEGKQICGAWSYYGRRMPTADDKDLVVLALCRKCRKHAEKRTDVPGLPPVFPPMTKNELEILREAVWNYADSHEPRDEIVAVAKKIPAH